jgi:alkylation response protein AidB-like acyl-CoA dehydrogenase
MTDPNLLATDVEEALRAGVRELLTDKADPATVLASVESDPFDRDLWRTLASLGATSLPVPESLGGQGASWREAAVVAEELGRAVTPVPFLTSSVLATAALLELSDDENARDALRRMASGESVVVLAIPLSTFTASVDGPPAGTVRSVADAGIADQFLVPADGALYLVDAAIVDPVVSLDLTRPIADVTFDGSGVRLTGDARSAVDSALRTGAGLLAAEQVGIADWCLTTTVAYLKQRYQFGRQVGSFQSLKHRLADLWQSIALARATALNAADALATGSQDSAVAVAVAQSLCSTVAVRAAEECVQLHGGIGMTWEHPAHLFLKRAKADELALGTPGRHRAALASLVDLPA